MAEPARKAPPPAGGTDAGMLDELPAVLAAVAAAAGLAAALRLAHEFGGTEIYVPKQVRPGHTLELRLGLEAATVLARLYGGGRVMVPQGVTARQARMRSEIRRLLGEGMSESQVARRVGCHAITVRRVRRRLRAG